MEKEWVSKMGTFVGTLLCILILPVVVINCTLLFKSHINRERVPNIAGTFPMVVLTDSMYPEFQGRGPDFLPYKICLGCKARGCDRIF